MAFHEGFLEPYQKSENLFALFLQFFSDILHYFYYLQNKLDKFWNKLVIMDKFDRQIIEILQENGRITISELADRVGLSKTPCNARLKRLIENGTILGFTALVNYEALERNHIAFTEVKLNDTRDASLKAFNKGVMAIPEVEHCHMIAGQFDYLLKVRTKDIQAYRWALGEKISSLPCVANTSTHVVMEAVKE